MLAGDAAHPTSPHLGQGANQALEDCYHLSQALPDLTPRKEEGKLLDDDDNLEQIFAAYAEKRQPRTAALVRGARAAGQKRVVTTGSRDCEARNLVSLTNCITVVFFLFVLLRPRLFFMMMNYLVLYTDRLLCWCMGCVAYRDVAGQIDGYIPFNTSSCPSFD